LTVTNLLGEITGDLVNGFLSAGIHNVQYDGRKIPSGVYFYTLAVYSPDGNLEYKASKKLVLMK
ncbi:MAG: hypothetical protein LWX56_09015, partial [Ignavibacteria bacterium]|nr:hypothetical protein [Ignavibacteria bacterium]